MDRYIHVRTIKSIRQHADKEHSEQDPKIPRQTSLCMLVGCAAFVCVVCSRAYLVVTVRVSACVYGCLPACVDTLQCFDVVPRHQNRDPGMVMVTQFQIYFWYF